MNYNPYESKSSKKRRIISDILIVLIVLLFIWGIYNIFFNKSVKVKHFEVEKTSVEMTDDETDEFLRLYSKTSSKKSYFDKSAEFDSEFPVAAAMLDMDAGVYNKNKPYMFFGSKYFAVAQTVLAESTGCRDLEIALIKTDVSVSDISVKISATGVHFFKLRYDTRTGKINYAAYDASTFHMDVYDITFNADGGEFTDTTYEINLSESVSVSEEQNFVYDPVRRSAGTKSANANRVKGSIGGNPLNKAKLAVNFDGDLIYDIKNFTIEFVGDIPESVKISATVN